MRRSRRGGQVGLEFGGSGEDSFVAVVVTKLTGALLFILLLTMVIMALLPKAIDLPDGAPFSTSRDESAPLAIATPGTLPEAIAGHPYVVALAATGGRGPLHWAVDGHLPDGLSLDPESGRLHGTPRVGTARPAELVLRVSDGEERTSQASRLVVYQSDRPLTTPSWWKPGLPPVPWRAWLEQGIGFLLLWLVHLVGLGAIASIERGTVGAIAAGPEPDAARLTSARRRFAIYRAIVRLTTLSATIALAVWLWRQRAY